VRVLRIYHSAVVASWRRRDLELIALGVQEQLVSPHRWNEGGRDVVLDAQGDDFLVRARTFGRHPYVFAYDPRPIWRALRRGRFDVIDVHEEPASLAAWEVRVVARLAGHRRTPITFYGAQNIEKRFPPPFRWIERSSLRRAAGAHVCNREAGEIFRRKGFRGVVRVIGLGVDVDRFAPLQPHREEHHAFTVGYVGRLEAHKGVGVLLDAIAPLSDVHVSVFGDGPEADALRQRAQRLGLAARVRFHGFTPAAELPDAYRTVDVVAVPSQETSAWVEQFGRVAVEAMASGVPVIASDSGSLPEVVGDAGILLPPTDIGAWTAAIATLRDDPERRAQLGERGRTRATAYSWPAIARAHLDFYEDVIAACS
jgi:glycosyltransferase involved in cell wall biosynthesis